MAKVTAHDDSSSPGPCTFRRGAEGAPCSGQTHPGRQASPEVSAEKERGRGRGERGENLQLQRELSQCSGIPPFACLPTFVSQRLR